jgi:hypothetical protein
LKIKWNAFGRNVYAWGLVHIGDRFDEPLCRIKAMSTVARVDNDEVVTCLQCLVAEVARGQEA